MQRNRLLTLLGIMTIAIAGCAGEETPVATTSPSPTTTPSPSPSPAVTTPSTQPLTAQRPGLPAPVPGLIQSTNPGERSRQVETEIRTNQGNNPFEALPPVIPNPAGGTSPVPTVSQLPGNRPGGAGPAGQPRTTAQPASPGRGTPASPGRGTTEQPTREVETPSIPKIQSAPLGVNLPPVATGTSPAGTALPPRPSTDTAEAVEVTGVIVVGSAPQAIVVAPGDATSRYVSAGQRISGGKVLVKRIEVGNGSDPVVILEENGVEVARSVGEKPPRPGNNSAA